MFKPTTFSVESFDDSCGGQLLESEVGSPLSNVNQKWEPECWTKSFHHIWWRLLCFGWFSVDCQPFKKFTENCQGCYDSYSIKVKSNSFCIQKLLKVEDIVKYECPHHPREYPPSIKLASENLWCWILPTSYLKLYVVSIFFEINVGMYLVRDRHR